MSKFIITEEEKRNILLQYNLINEADYGSQRLNIGDISGKTYSLFLEPNKGSSKFEWENPKDTHPKPVNFLPKGKTSFTIKPKSITYFSGSPEMNYSFVCSLVTDGDERYYPTTMYTDKEMIKNGKFKVTMTYGPGSTKAKWANEVFYGYSDDLKNDMVTNKLI